MFTVPQIFMGLFTAGKEDFVFRTITICTQMKITLKKASYPYIIVTGLFRLVMPEPTGTRMPVLSKMTFDISLWTPLSPFTGFVFPLP